jgi:uncharacterized protein (TIGR00299 family) protein
MQVAHFDCFSGISGDMALAALIDAGVDLAAIQAGVSSLGLPVSLQVEKVSKGGFAATLVTVDAPEEKSHRHLPEIEQILGRGSLKPRQRELAMRIFRRLAEAEARAHGLPLEMVHFHEVGALDSIVDIAGVAIGLDLIQVERFTSRPVPTGSGMIKCAHGLVPVPAPGTIELLKGVPLAASTIQAELTTPTGAAILTSVVTSWVEQPVMTVERIGNGAGKRDLVEQPNLLRLLVGTAVAPMEGDRVWVVETNLDDVPAEVIGYCYDVLRSAGALDVFSTPIFMKKNRPGVMLSVLVPEGALSAVERILFRETGTLGVRRYSVHRQKLQRRPCAVETAWGPVQGKLAWSDSQPAMFSPEYEDCARLAREKGIPLREVLAAAQEAYIRTTSGPPRARP